MNVAVLGGTILPAYWRFPYDYPLRTDVYISAAEMQRPAGPLLPGVRYAQSFVAHQQNLTKVEVEFATFSRRIAAGLLKMGLRQTLDGEDIASWTIPANTIRDNAFVGLSFPAIPDSKGKTYYIEFEIRDPSQPITVWLSSGNVYAEGSFFVDGQAKSQDTCFRTLYGAGPQQP